MLTDLLGIDPSRITAADAVPAQNSLAASWKAFRTSSHAA
jgi:hypothetical protein